MVNLTDRVAEVEARVDGIQLGVDALRSDVQSVEQNLRTEFQTVERNFASVLEQFAWMRARWEEQERERKNKDKMGEYSSGVVESEVIPEPQGRRAETEGGGGVGRTDVRGHRLEMPFFEGEDPDGWIFRAERYFSVNDLSEGEKLETAALCLEGAALSWFQWEER